jgi:hypothetical protein
MGASYSVGASNGPRLLGERQDLAPRLHARFGVTPDLLKLKITGPNLLAPCFARSGFKIKQFDGRLFSA